MTNVVATMTLSTELQNKWELEDKIAARIAIRRPEPILGTTKTTGHLVDDDTQELIAEYESIELDETTTPVSSSFSSSSSSSSFSDRPTACTTPERSIEITIPRRTVFPNAAVTAPPAALLGPIPTGTSSHRPHPTGRQVRIRFIEPQRPASLIPDGYIDDDVAGVDGVTEGTKVVVPSSRVYEPEAARKTVFNHIPSLMAVRNLALRARQMPPSYGVQATKAMRDFNTPDTAFSGARNWWIRASHTEVENVIGYIIRCRLLPTVDEGNEAKYLQRVLAMKVKYLKTRIQAQALGNEAAAGRTGKKRPRSPQFPRDRMLKMIQSLGDEPLLWGMVWCWECEDLHCPFKSVAPRSSTTKATSCNKMKTSGPVTRSAGGWLNPFQCLSGSNAPAGPLFTYHFQPRVTFPMISATMQARANGDNERREWLARQLGTTETFTARDGSRLLISQGVRILPRLESRTEALHSETKFVLVPRSSRPGDVPTDDSLTDLVHLALAAMPDEICPHVRTCSVIGPFFPVWMELKDNGSFAAIGRPVEEKVADAQRPSGWGRGAACTWGCAEQPCLGRCGSYELGLRKIRSCTKCWTEWSVAAVDLRMTHMDKAAMSAIFAGKPSQPPPIPEGPRWLGTGGVEMQAMNRPAPPSTLRLAGKTRAMVLTVRKDLGRGFDPETDRRWLASRGVYEAQSLIPGNVFVGWDTNGLAQPGRADVRMHEPIVQVRDLARLSEVRAGDWDGRTYRRVEQMPEKNGIVRDGRLDETAWPITPPDQDVFVVGEDSDSDE